MKKAHLPKFPAICDLIIKGFIIFLIVFTPLAFGTMELWSVTVMECIAFMALAVWLVKMTYEGELTFCKLWVNIPIAIILGLILLQLLPLPPKVLGLISPKTFHIYKETIPDWPQHAPFETIRNTSSELGIHMPAHENLSSAMDISLYPHVTQNELLKVLTYLFLFYIVINNFKDRRTLERLTVIITMMGFLLAVFGLIQYFTWNGKIYWFRELRYGGAPFGPFVNRNHFAGYMEMVIPLTIGNLVARTLQIRSPHPGLGSREKALAFFSRETSLVVFLYSAVIIMMLSLIFTLSRGGILSLLVGIIIFASLMPKRKRLTPIFAILGVIFLLGAGQEMVVARFFNIGPLGRYSYWEDSVGIFKDFPILGTGLGTFPWIFRMYQSTEPDVFVDYAHNDYIQLLVEMGFLGLFAALGACVLYFIYVVSLLGRRVSTYTKAMVCGGIASLGTILAHSVVDFNLHIPSNALLATLIAALTLGLVCAYEKNKEPKTLLRFWKLRLDKRWSTVTGYGMTGAFLVFLLSLPIRNGLAGAYYHLSKEERNPLVQVALLQRASRLQPLNGDYPQEIGSTYVLRGKRNTALPFLMKAIHLRPTDPYLHLQMAALLDTFISFREVPQNYEPWERTIGQQLKASMGLFPIGPEVHAEVCKLLLKRWSSYDDSQKRVVLSILRRTLEMDNGKHSEAVLEALWNESKDISLIRNAIPKSSKRYERLSRIVEKLENNNENTKGNTAN